MSENTNEKFSRLCGAKISVIGGGLAGCEAAYYLARRGANVTLYEMKPKKYSPAHESPLLCELVCSNSLKSADIYANACGLLKEEMRILGSLTMEPRRKPPCLRAARLP